MTADKDVGGVFLYLRYQREHPDETVREEFQVRVRAARFQTTMLLIDPPSADDTMAQCIFAVTVKLCFRGLLARRVCVVIRCG